MLADRMLYCPLQPKVTVQSALLNSAVFSSARCHFAVLHSHLILQVPLTFTNVCCVIWYILMMFFCLVLQIPVFNIWCTILSSSISLNMHARVQLFPWAKCCCHWVALPQMVSCPNLQSAALHNWL